MRNLSKSKIIAFRQCPKRLWLEIYKPELRDDSGSEMMFQIGHEVGDIARDIYDPDKTGDMIDIGELGHGAALSQSAKLLAQGKAPIIAGRSRHAPQHPPKSGQAMLHYRSTILRCRRCRRRPRATRIPRLLPRFRNGHVRRAHLEGLAPLSTDPVSVQSAPNE